MRVAALGTVGKANFLCLPIDGDWLSIELNLPAPKVGEDSPGQRFDPSEFGVEKAGVVPDRVLADPQRPVDHFLERGLGDEASTPSCRQLRGGHCPQLVVVGNHDVLGETFAQALENELGKVFWLARPQLPALLSVVGLD